MWFHGIPQQMCHRCIRRFSRSTTHHDKAPWRVLFFGTDEYSLSHFKALNENRIQSSTAVSHLEAVISTPKCPVYKYAEKFGVPIHDWPLPDLTGHFDVGVIVSFGHLIPETVIQMFPRGILNVHPSLLPKWRGASPINHSILNGDTETAISIMEIMPHQFDVGPLLAQVKIPIAENATAASLRDDLAETGSKILIDCLTNLDSIERKQQDPSIDPGPYARKINLKHTFVNWNKQSVLAVDRQYRALVNNFSLRSSYGNIQVRLENMVPPSFLPEQAIESLCKHVEDSHIPGTPVYLRNQELLCIRCQDGWVGFKEINVKKPMTAKSFYNGYLSKKENKKLKFESKENGLDKYFQ